MLALPPPSPVFQSGGPANGPFVLFYLSLGLALLAALGLIAWRRWQSRRALVARLKELALLEEIGRSIVDAPLDLHALAETIYRQTGKMVEADLFQLGLFDGDRYRLLVWIVDGQPRAPAEFRLTADSPGIIGWVRDQRQSLLVRDFATERDSLPARPRYQSADPPRSAVFVPRVAGEAALGVIAIQSRRPGAYSEEDLRLLTILANHAAAALRNARALEQASRRASQLELLAQVSQRINALQPLPDLYRELVSLVAARFAEYDVSFFELDGDRLRLCVTTRREWAGREVTFGLGQGAVGRAAAEVEPVVIQELPEYSGDPETGPPPAEGAAWREAWRPEAAALAVPVEIDRRVLGVLAAHTREPAAFDEAATAVFGSLASQMAIAILEAQTYQAERRRSEQLAAIARAARAVTSTLDLDDLLMEVLALLAEREYFGYERARIYLAQDSRLVCAASSLPEEAARVDGSEAAGLVYRLDGPELVPQVARDRQALLLSDAAAQSEQAHDPRLDGARAWMAAPMVMGEHLIGVFEIHSEQPGAFGEPDLQTLQTLADYLAVAVRNARLFAAERRRRRLADILREVSAALTSTLDLDQLLDMILDGLARVVQYDTASILLTEEGRPLSLRATRGAPAAQAALGKVFDVQMYAAGEEHPATIPFNEVDRWGDYHTLLALPEPHACLGALLAAQGQHIGYLVVDRAGQSEFAPEEVEVISAFASQAAVAIENARLYTREREQAWLSSALLQVSEATAHAASLDEVLELVTRLTPSWTGLPTCAVLLRVGHEPAFRIVPPDLDETTVWLDDFPPLAVALETREPSLIEDVEALPERLRRRFAGRSLLLPLVTRERALGALIVGPVAGEGSLSDLRRELLGGIANQAAVALESALLAREAALQQRLDHELDVARDIQASFLPGQCPQPPGWQMAAYWQAARMVGGDFYDFIPLRPAAGAERWGLVIADVADKGVPAALLMVLSRTLLRTLAISLVSPAATLRRVNRLIQADARTQTFVTVLYGVWEPAAGTLRYAVGGHHPPIWMDAQGNFRATPGHGPALGVYEAVEYEEHEIRLAPGDVLVLFTDGLLDAVNAADEEFGMARLLEVLRESRGGTAEAIQQAITAAVSAHVGPVEAFDDLTMVVMKRDGLT